jgi:hypothetical protein
MSGEVIPPTDGSLSLESKSHSLKHLLLPATHFSSILAILSGHYLLRMYRKVNNKK